ncbi:hypothetical protein LTR66_010889 [Elasticomyces elasticus]|nr:hypothetical protein LTR66_010889 [Elasticomyces elasticus]KAK4993686.1 hypothetical protein LTR50_000297 [Elasticomyces elasticus]
MATIKRATALTVLHYATPLIVFSLYSTLRIVSFCLLQRPAKRPENKKARYTVLGGITAIVAVQCIEETAVTVG